MSYADEVMELPEEERLPTALAMLSDLTGGNADRVTALRHEFGISPMLAAILAHLLRRAGWVVSYEQLFLAVWGYDSDTEREGIKVFMHRLRRRVPMIDIETIWGVGYRLPVEDAALILGRIDAARGRAAADGGEGPDRDWTPPDDTLLRAWVGLGYSFAALCQGTGRSERAILERMAYLGLDG